MRQTAQTAHQAITVLALAMWNRLVSVRPTSSVRAKPALAGPMTLVTWSRLMELSRECVLSAFFQ